MGIRDPDAEMWRAFDRIHPTQELGPEYHWVSELLFGIMFALFVMWTFSPFFTQHKRFYTAVMWSRLLMVLVGELLDR